MGTLQQCEPRGRTGRTGEPEEAQGAAGFGDWSDSGRGHRDRPEGVWGRTLRSPRDSLGHPQRRGHSALRPAAAPAFLPEPALPGTAHGTSCSQVRATGGLMRLPSWGVCVCACTVRMGVRACACVHVWMCLGALCVCVRMCMDMYGCTVCMDVCVCVCARVGVCMCLDVL